MEDIRKQKARLWAEVKSAALRGMEQVVNKPNEIGIIDVTVRNTVADRHCEGVVIYEFGVELCQDANGKWFVESEDLRIIEDTFDDETQ